MPLDGKSAFHDDFFVINLGIGFDLDGAFMVASFCHGSSLL